LSDAHASLRLLDSGDMVGATQALPDHLRDALWRVESLRLEPIESSGLVVCGMGGSAIGGDLAVAALGSRLRKPLSVVRGYALPVWTPTDRAVLCSSYSGDTEETIACYEAAEVLGAPRIVATTGGSIAEAARRDSVPVIGLPAGLQPRAAVGYMLTVAAEIASLCGAADTIRMEIDSSAAHLEGRRDELGERAEQLAVELDGTVPVIYGSDLTAPVAYRWKTQLNENSKLPAFSHQLPELDHNEIAGWKGAGGGLPMSAVVLTDRDQHPRERRRFELTASLIEPDAAHVAQVETVGDSRTERLLWAVMLGDLVSLQLAARRGVDPTRVEVIEQLKDELGRP
jgi:glucose/mannose-6-phosphate isomerase